MFLFPPCDTILENNSDALGIKSLILRVYLAIQRSSENIDPIKIDKYGIQTIKNGNVSLLSLYKKIYIQKYYLLFWCQDLKMKHGFLDSYFLLDIPHNIPHNIYML